MKRTLLSVFAFSLFCLPFVASASIVSGTIDSSYKTAKGVDSGVGKFNLGTSQGNVTITDTAVTGYMWSQNYGWVNFAPANGGVFNDAEGNLTGYGWGEQTGWFTFKATSSSQQVTIDSDGYFNGYAWAQNLGWISFNCAGPGVCGSDDYKVRTDWRPKSTRPACSDGVDNDSDGQTDYSSDTGCTGYDDTSEAATDSGGSGGSGSSSGSAQSGETPGYTPPSETPGPVTPTENPSNEPGDGETPGAETPSGNDTPGPSSGDDSRGTISSAIESVASRIGGTIGVTRETVTQVVAEAREVLKDNRVAVATKAVATAGAVTGAAATVGTLFLTPFTAAETFLIPLRIWTVLMSALGLRKRFKPWGTVYDSVTKQPLDPAYVMVYDLAGKMLNTSITDLNGRFGFLLPPGTYRIEAKKTNYLFPSAKLMGKSSDILYSNLYFGENFVTIGEGEVIARNIPLDPIGFDWNEYAKAQKGLTSVSSRKVLLEKIQQGFFAAGFVVALIAFLLAPAPYNSIIFIAYLATLALRYIGFTPRSAGSVLEKGTNTPMPFAIVRVFSKTLGREITHRVTDKLGRYYCLVPEGVYTVSVEKKIGENEYQSVYTSEPFFAKKGIIKQSWQV